MRYALVLILCVAACSKGPQADLPAIGEARSLAAEWALINEQSDQGRLTPTYTQAMRQDLREQLQTTAQSLAQPHSQYGAEIAALLAERDDAAPGELRARAARLKRIEDSLESD